MSLYYHTYIYIKGNFIGVEINLKFQLASRASKLKKNTRPAEILLASDQRYFRPLTYQQRPAGLRLILCRLES